MLFYQAAVAFIIFGKHAETNDMLGQLNGHLEMTCFFQNIKKNIACLKTEPIYIDSSTYVKSHHFNTVVTVRRSY